MIDRIFVAALLVASAAPALAQQTPADLTGAPVAASDVVPVSIDTSLGRIVIGLDRLHAPITTANFLSYVDAHKYDGETFYRAMPFGDGGGLIQGGISSDARKLNKPIAFESTNATGLSNTAGTIAMAAAAPGQAQAAFILTTDIKEFDGPNGFAAFGRVIEGMDVAKAILAAPVSPTKGEGPMKGQMLDPPVKILKAARLK